MTLNGNNAKGISHPFITMERRLAHTDAIDAIEMAFDRQKDQVRRDTWRRRPGVRTTVFRPGRRGVAK